MSEKTTIRYRFCWSRLSLFRDYDQDAIGLGSSSERVFTLWPKFLWWRITDWIASKQNR